MKFSRWHTWCQFGTSGVGREPRLFVGCCAMSYSRYLRSGQMTMEDFIRKGAADANALIAFPE